MKGGFVPNEDMGVVFVNVELPVGASIERTDKVLAQIQTKVKNIEGIKGISFSSGRNFFSGTGSNNGMAFIMLKDFEERAKNPAESIEAITGKLFGAVGDISEARIVFFQPAGVPGFGMSAGAEFVLLDKAGQEIKEIDKTAQEFMGALMQRPEIQYAQTSFNTNYPQYEMEINVPRAMESGVSVSSLLSTLQGYIGGLYAADFTKYGKQFRVMVQALPEDRKDTSSLDGLYVKTKGGEMAPISQFVSLKRVYGPQSINRYNLFTSVKVTGANNPGFSTGDVINVVREVADEHLPANYGIDFTGLTREEINAGSQTIVIFMLSLVFVYFILSAQYESYIVPLSVIISLPLGVMGAFIGQKFAGLENNIYFQIALIMLVGLLAKNAILIVEFALQRRRHGERLAISAINAAKARIRPILMTSLAFIVGLMPLVLANGIGAVGNRSIATGAAIGLLIGTVLGLIVIPVLYVVFQWIQEKISPLKKEEQVHLSE